MSEWGPWQYRGMPTVGMYVQAECWHEITGEESTHEGRVAGIENGVAWFEGESPKRSCFWVVRRWRARRGGGFRVLERILELEDA